MAEVVSALFLLLATAQGSTSEERKPDFSGVWKFNAKESKLEIQAPESTTVEIVHRDPVFRLTRTHVIQGKSDTFSIELWIGGKETLATLRDSELRCRAFWEAGELVFVTKIHSPKGEAENLVRYRLSTSGRQLIATERFRGPGQSYDNLWVLDKE